MTTDKQNECVLCGEPLVEFGHNPWPLSTMEEGLCCGDCNWGRVLPARMALSVITDEND